MKYVIKKAMEIEERAKALEVRQSVFVEEQQVPPSLEYDAYDEQNNVDHLLITTQTGKVFGTARLRPYEGENGKVQRVAILAEYRGLGGGVALMEAVEVLAKERGFKILKLDAQVQARKFYERLGYQAQGKVFWDANIEHISMVKPMGEKG